MRKAYPLQPFGGIDKSKPAHEIELNYTPDCGGVWPSMGRMERIYGKAKHVGTQLAGAGILRHYRFLDGARVEHDIAISTIKAYRVLSGAYQSIQDANDFTTTADDNVAACNFFDSTGSEIMVVANIRDVMRKWGGASTLATLGGSPPKAMLLLHFRGHLLAGYVDESGTLDPRKVRFSSLYNGEDWPADNNFKLKTTTDWLIAMRLLRDRAVLYKSNSISLLDYVGGSLVFDLTENYKNGIGPVNDRAVVEWGRQGEIHYFLGQDTNVYAFDGIDDAKISDAVGGLLENISPAKKHLISGVAMPVENKIIWAIPYGGHSDCKDLLIFDVKERSWWIKYDEPIAITSFGQGKLSSGFTWDTLPYTDWDQWADTTWDSRHVQANNPEVLIGCADGYVRKFAVGVDDDGAAIPSRYLYPFDNLDGRDDTLKMVNRIVFEVMAKANGAIKVEIFADHNVTDAVVVDESGNRSKSLPIFGSELNKAFMSMAIDVSVIGRTFAVKVSAEGLSWSGKLKAFDFEIIGEAADAENGGFPYAFPFTF